MIEKQFEDEKTFYKQAQGNIATAMLPKKIKQKTKQHYGILVLVNST